MWLSNTRGCRDLRNSLSVLIAECGFDNKTFLLSEMDVVRALHISRESEIFEKVHMKDSSSQELLNNRKKETSDGSTSTAKASLFDYIVEYFLSVSHSSSREVAVQTESSSIGIMETLDSQLKDLHQSFLTRRDAERTSPAKSVSIKILIYEYCNIN